MFALQKRQACPVLLSAGIRFFDLSIALRTADIRVLIFDSGKNSQEVLTPELLSTGGVDSVLLAGSDIKCAFARTRSEREPSAADDALIVPTSGSEVESKAVIVKYDAFKWGPKWILDRSELSASDRRLILTPMHVGPSLMYSMANFHRGASVFVLDQPFQPDAILQTIQDYQITNSYAVPFLMQAMLDRGAGTRYPIETFRLAFTGSSLVSESLVDSWCRKIPHSRLILNYGNTEVFAPMLGVFNETSLRKPRCFGRPPAPEAEANRAQDGELLLRSPYRYGGYFRAPKLNMEKFDPEGWYHTGDLVEVDADGDYIFQGRKSDVINSFGYKISPGEVEGALLTMPGVKNAKVFGMECPERGEICVAAVQVTNELSESELAAKCAERIAGYKVPLEIVILGQNEESASQKLEKQKIIEKIKARWNQRKS